MTDTALLRQIIEGKGFKYSYIAKEMGLSAFGLSKKIDNINEFKTSEVDTLCRILGIKDLKLKERIFFARTDDLKSTATA